MAFVVKKPVIDELDIKAKEFTHEPTGLKVSFNPSSDKYYQKANEQLMMRERVDVDNLKNKAMDDSFLDDLKIDDKSASELWLRAVAKFLIVDWNAVDENGDKLEITGDNFILLIDNIDDAPEFLQWCTACAGDVASQKSKDTAETKKKPSSVTSGKKTTQA